MKIMFSAGEASGDMHGANLARALKELDPEVELLGMGGSRMADAVYALYMISRTWDLSASGKSSARFLFSFVFGIFSSIR